ncbi:hypothetical protein LOAG_07438 [Loa loa]|uniref:Uncharacterized protein n=1 Tax=Loa loa TaxID=7209 RepID=A0A1S0TW98_LOALO|nr:hypothetical protein LOAG_07438 [Loa loa]EFO21051.1 hypothetical protein LOAG_07438 [Loa loa]
MKESKLWEAALESAILIGLPIFSSPLSPLSISKIPASIAFNTKHLCLALLVSAFTIVAFSILVRKMTPKIRVRSKVGTPIIIRTAATHKKVRCNWPKALQRPLRPVALKICDRKICLFLYPYYASFLGNLQPKGYPQSFYKSIHIAINLDGSVTVMDDGRGTNLKTLLKM